MKYEVGNIFVFPDGTKGIVANVLNNIIGGQELDVDVNGEIRFVYIDENGNIKK